MIQKRKSSERGHTKIDWLDSYHTFSFDEYYDPDHMSFRTLRVINEDVVNPGKGFGTHPHRDMEILTCVLAGVLEHKDSMGNGSLIRPGDIQRMTAGTGITHSEFNHSSQEPVHLLQIWILPEKRNLEPGYEQKNFSDKMTPNRFQLVASRDGREGSVTVHQDVSLFLAKLDAEKTTDYALAENRHAWIQVAQGSVRLNGELLRAGDGAAVSRETQLIFDGVDEGDSRVSEILLFDLA